MMLSRLILLLLCACLAVPAMASMPCHDTPTMAGMTMPHDAPAPASENKALAVHVCIGCVPPASLLRAGLSRPLPRLALPRMIPALQFDRRPTNPPATPPPRADA